MADTVYYCPYCNRHSCHVAVHVEDKCEAAQIADAADEMENLRLALETATRERDEARAARDKAYHATAVYELRLDAVSDERDAAVARLNATEALLLDVWDSQHREGWEATETERSVIDRLGDWRWNNGFDPYNPPLRPDPRQKGAPE